MGQLGKIICSNKTVIQWIRQIIMKKTEYSAADKGIENDQKKHGNGRQQQNGVERQAEKTPLASYTNYRTIDSWFTGH